MIRIGKTGTMTGVLALALFTLGALEASACAGRPQEIGDTGITVNSQYATVDAQDGSGITGYNSNETVTSKGKDYRLTFVSDNAGTIEIRQLIVTDLETTQSVSVTKVWDSSLPQPKSLPGGITTLPALPKLEFGKAYRDGCVIREI